jgi:hypothetical protein
MIVALLITIVLIFAVWKGLASRRRWHARESNLGSMSQQWISEQRSMTRGIG